jgi:acetolactate synthase small subunit
MKAVAEKFCKRVATPEKRAECEEEMENIFRSFNGKELDVSLEKLVEITGKPKSVLKKELAVCPLCGENH